METHNMEFFSNLDQATQMLQTRGEGILLAEEQADGKMKYTVTNETSCYGFTTPGPNYIP